MACSSRALPAMAPIRRCICIDTLFSRTSIPRRGYSSPPRRSAPHLPRCQPFHMRGRAHQRAASSLPNTDPANLVQRPRRSLRPYIYATFFLLSGLGTGHFVRAIVLPPPLPQPDSAEDHILLSKLRKDIDALPIVQELRTRRDVWLEFEAYMDQAEAQRIHSMTAGAMSGARGLGVQRIFWNKAEQRLLGVVFLGGAITGWPGVTHGGAVATLLQENLDRVANGPEIWPKSDQRQHVLDDVKINYLKPTQANRIYVVRAEMDSEGELKREGGSVLADHLCVKATIEDAWTGVTTAAATGRCTIGPVKLVKEEANSLWNRYGWG